MDSQVQENKPKVFIVGEEFQPGSCGNAEIDAMLGHQTVLCGDQAVRTTHVQELAPDYCTDTVLALAELEALGIAVMVAGSERTAHSAKTMPVKGRVAIFAFGDALHLTRPFLRASDALACALWFCLANQSALID